MAFTGVSRIFTQAVKTFAQAVRCVGGHELVGGGGDVV